MNGSFILLEYLFIYLHFEKISKKNYLFTSETFFTKKKRNCEMKLNWIDDLKCEKRDGFIWNMWWNCARSALRISPKNILKFPRRGVRGQNFENRPLIQSQDETKWSQLIKPTIFTIGFGSTLMCGNFIYKYEVKLKEKYQNFAVAGRNELNWKYFSNLPNEGAEKVISIHTICNFFEKGL